MKKFLIFAAVACLIGCSSFLHTGKESGKGKEPLVYKVTKLTETVKIDGNWNKPVWEKIKPLTINKYMGDKPEHQPKVQAKLAWDDNALYVIFHVEDRYVRAVAKEYQGHICNDSCVEFFFTPGSNIGLSYFNIEINCGGTMLFWWQQEGKKAIPVAAEDGERIEIGHILPKIVDPEIKEPTTWVLEYRLPFDVVKKYCPDATKPSQGAIWKANLYKCADATSHPHWLTWSFVDSPRPAFHVPKYFGTLKFE